MRSITDHRTLLTDLLGTLGVAVLVALLAHRLVRRAGGWSAVRRLFRRELALTVAAAVEPVRRIAGHRRRLRMLTRLLRQPRSWLAAERALQAAGTLLDGARPYAALVGADRVGVLVAGRDVPAPPQPWSVDPDEPRLWWLSTVDVELPRGDAVLVALGVEGAYAVLLDLAAGPVVTAVDGSPRVATALVQAIAAQLDDRLPDGSVLVSEGVHPRHAGPPADEVLRLATVHAADGSPAFAVCGQPPVGPVEGRSTLRLLVRGAPRGHARLLTAERNGLLTVHGTPLRPNVTALPLAVSRAIGELPACAPPPTAASLPGTVAVPARHTDSVDDDFAERMVADTGVSAANGGIPCG
jgi:hypothetical protein